MLSVGRRRYRVPSDLRRAVQLRDGTCRFPGCRRRAAGCDTDHVRRWADGGPTDLESLQTLCRHHHRLRHDGGWRVTAGPDGVLHWRSPAGLVAETSPASALGPPRATAPPATASSSVPSPSSPSSPSSPASSGYPEVPPF